MLGEPNPYLHIDKHGVIRSLSNIEFLGINEGKGVNDPLGYVDVNNKQVVLDDIIFDQAGDATFYANADSTYGSQGRIWGNEGLVESQRSWDYVTIINESEWDLVINHIDAIDGSAVVKVQVDNIPYDGDDSGNNSSNTAGTFGDTFEFRLNLFYPQTEVRIQNMDHALELPDDPYTPPVFDTTKLNKPASDIILLGGIENTFGHTYIINERGNIRVDEPALVVDDPDFPASNNPIEGPIFDEALVRTNTLLVQATGDIGNQSATDNPYSGSDGDRVRKALEVELMRIDHAVENTDTVSLKEVSYVAEAGGDAVLDITLHDRTTDGTSPLTVEIEKITAGDDVDVVINDSKAGDTPSSLNGVTVQTFNPEVNPDPPPLDVFGSPGPRSGSFFRYWSPDEDGGEAYYDFIARTLNTTATEVDSTYVFVEVRAGDDIDIGHVTTNDVYPNSLPGEENRSYRTTDIHYSIPNPNPLKITDIDVSPAASSTTVNFVVFGDVDWSLGTPNDEDGGGEQVFLTTNGFILAQEFAGDMLVGHIHSTADDVTLWSGGKILDADGTDTVDVTGVNITMYSGVPTGAGSSDAVLDLLVGQHDGETAGGLVIPNGVQNPSAGGIGESDDFLETNVNRNGSNAANGANLDAYDTNAPTNTGIYIDELTGALRVGQVETGGDVSLRTVDGSIVDRPEDGAEDATTSDIIAQAVDLDANGVGHSIGESGNDLDINSRNGSSGSEAFETVDLNVELRDVALEAYQSIFLSETEGALRLVLAHALYGSIRLTVRESSATEENLLLVDSGVANFAESDSRNPGFQDDHLRDILNGTIFAERGSVTLYVADNIAFDANADVLAAGRIDIYGDADFIDGSNQNSDLDDGYGSNMVLRGRIIANADVTHGNDGVNVTGDPAMGTAIPTYTAPGANDLTRIFGNDDVDTIQFGDESGYAGGTNPNDDGYIFLGSKTRAFGSQAVPVYNATTDRFDSTGDDGEDRFFVYFLQSTTSQTGPNVTTDAEHTLTLDGQADTDVYEIHTLGSQGDERNYVINVLDTGLEDDGVDEMTIFGLDSPNSGLQGDGNPYPTDDIFLLRAAAFLPSEDAISPETKADRPAYVALLHGSLPEYQDVVQNNEDFDEVQRINYDAGLNGRLIVEGRGGNDAFFSDDTTVIVTLDGGEGDDSFQIGQIFGAQRDEADGGLLPQDVFPDLVATTRGWLSPGISAPLVAQGGSGNDQFRVYSNQAELRLEGDDDNDLFIVRAFALAATVDFDFDNSGVIDNADIDAGVAILQALQQAQDDNGFNTDQAIDYLANPANVVSLGLADIFGVNLPDTAYLDAFKAAVTGPDFDINGDGGINALDLLLTADPTDDVIPLDEDGVATPQIGLKFSVAQAPDIRAGGGQDEVRYNINAPVSVDGGAGFDKLVILGTEFADDIVITKDGIFGAGLNVRYSTIEVVEVDGLEGDDEFFVLSTAFGVAYRVIGGLGSDTINVGGDVVEDIITRELEGVSGAVDHLVSSDDPLYDGVVVDGFDYNVSTALEGLVVINEEAAGDTSPGRTVVREESVTTDQFADVYTVRLSQELTGNQVVYVTVSAARSTQEERDIDPDTGEPYDLNPPFLTDALGDTIWLSTDPMSGAFTNTYSGLATTADDSFLHKIVINGQDVWVPDRAVVLKFDASNWDQEQNVYVFAPDDARSEGDRVVVIQHSVISNVEIYDGADVRNVEVQVYDNDTPGVYVRQVDALGNLDDRTIVVEGTDVTRLTDQIELSLAKAPANGTQVVVDIVLNDFADKAIKFFDKADLDFDGLLDGVGADDRLTLFNNPIYDAVNDRIVVGRMKFTDGDWNSPIVVGVEARDDYVREDLQIAVVEFERNDDDDATTDDDYIFPNLRSGLQLLDVEVYDNETSGAVVLESGTSTQLIKDIPPGSGKNDTYSIRLTREPDDTVRVAVLTDGLADVVKIGATTISPEDYAVIGGLRATQMFNGNLIFGDDGTFLTITRGEGSDLGSFIDEGFYGDSLAAHEVFSDSLTFGYNGSNLALISTGADLSFLGFAASDTIRISAPSAGGFDANNDDYEVLSVSSTEIVLTQIGAWSVAGTSSDAVSLSEFVPVEGQRIRIGGAGVNDGDYQIMSISSDGQTLTLTAVGSWAAAGPTTDPAVLSDLTENTFFEGTVSYGDETDPDLFPGQFLDRMLIGEQEGWLSEGFLEGMWVRIIDLNGVNPDVEAKIQLIRGDNDSKDAKLQLINVTIDEVTQDLSATWLNGSNLDVRVVRIAPEVVFSGGDESAADAWHKLQTVELAADVNYVVPPTREGVKIFPVSTHLLSKLRGPLAVEGGPAGADRSLTAGVKLPGEKDDFLIAIGAQPPESQQIDVLKMFNDSSQADGTGVMDQTTLRGFGMADDLVFKGLDGPLYGEAAEGSSEITVPGGISFGKVNYGSVSVGTDGNQSTIEVFNLMLGQGNDYLDIGGTLDPAPFVSAQNEFDFNNVGEDLDYLDNPTIRWDGFDWKAQGFLPGQIVTIEGLDPEAYNWIVVSVEDAFYLDGHGLQVPDGMGGFLRDPNDNSILVLTGPDFPVLIGEQKIIAVDPLVLEAVTYGVAYTTTGGILTRSDSESWEDHGFLEGHLINIGGEDGSFADAKQYRVLSIAGDVMEVLGDPIASAAGVTANIWVQGPHGSLTMVHGGGNLPVQTIGSYETKTYQGQDILARLDGRSWQDDRYVVGQLIQIGDETETRKILGFGDAADFGVVTPDGQFATWGTDSVMILSGDDFGVPATITDIDVHRSIPLRVEVQIEATLVVDTLTRAAGSWLDDGFDVGQVVYIEGLAGGFTVKSVTETDLVLDGAAIHDCVIEEGSTITVYRIDLHTDDGAYVGGDHFVIAPAHPDSALAGPDSPLVVYGDTSQDGVWYSGHSYDRLGLEFGEKPFNPFPDLPDEENEDDEWVFPLANRFVYFGNDIIDASAMFAGVALEDLPSVGFTAYGGAGNDLIIGSQAGDHLAGGSGDDTIYGQGGTDHIYGDSGVNVDILTRALYIPTVDASPAPSVDPLLGASDQTFKPVKVLTPMRDDMVAGDDFIDGNGSGNPDLPNIIFGDHGVVVQYVDDPNLPPFLLQKIQTTELSTVLEINSAELQNGGDDVLYGDDIPDILIGGAGNDMLDGREDDDLIFGDNVYLTRMGGADDNLLDDILNYRFQTLAGTLMYSRTDRPVPDGVDPNYAYDASGPNSLHEYTSGRLLTDGTPRNYRDPNGPQWWAEYEIDYAGLHTFSINNGLSGVGSFGNDYIAGGAGNDEIFGQLGHDVIQGDGSIDDAVNAIAHVGAARKPLRLDDPNGPGIDDPVGPLFVVASFEAASDGQDYIEGGGGKDVIFGGLGQDDLVGGSSDFFSLAAPDNRPDDKDWIFGGAGTQIDRNNGFDPNADTDGDDETFGEDVVVTVDTAFDSKHGRDSDAIAGDNADIIRIVGVNHIDVNPHPEANPFGQNYVTFNYDNYGGEKIVVRGIRLLDYTAGGPDFKPDDFSLVDPSTTPDPSDDEMRPMFSLDCDPTHGIWARYDIGGNDEVHGETGDDFIYLGGGFDIAFGDADSDDIIGGWGHDWISGGTGTDGILGDDGRIFTSRNTSEADEAESLYGVEALLDRDPDTRTSQGNVLNELIHTPGNVQVELINVEGELKKSVDLTPFNLTAVELGAADPTLSNQLFADDVIFGGLGDDFIHGGSGDDAISGAEAVTESYAPRFDSGGVLVGLIRTDFSRPSNPSDILHFGDGDPHWNEPKPVQSRTGEFFLYNEYDPRRVILFEDDGNGTVWTGDVETDGALPPISEDGLTGGDGKLLQYFLNARNDEGVSVLGYVAFKPDGQTPDPDVPPEYRQSDGDDVMFGDLGNDWMVGGTGRDHIYGGFGNDLMNADDVLGTVNPDPPQNNPGQLPLGGTDETPDTHPVYEDRVFGGAGLDILIGNTRGDRLIDWVGEFNSYIVPFAPFGIATVSRQVPPHLFDFLYAQAFGDGADITRTADTGQSNHNDRYSNVALLQGGIYGEIALVTQQDHGYWQDQTGGPTDPQAGNVPGGRRDVLRSADFNDGSMSSFAVDSGVWTVTQGALHASAAALGEDAMAVFYVDDYLPVYYEISASIKTQKPTGGWKANAYVIFDYFSPTDFKFAGIDVSINKFVMGHRTPGGWIVDVQSPLQVKPDVYYQVLVAVNGTTVTVVVDNKTAFTYTFPARVIDDVPYGLNKGLVGAGSVNARGTWDNFAVRVLPPQLTLDETEDFDDGVADRFTGDASGAPWTVINGRYEATAAVGDTSVQTVDLGIDHFQAYSYVELQATLKTNAIGGLVFDEQAPDRYKFVALDIASQKVLLGHFEPNRGWVVDKSVAKTLAADTDYTVGLVLKGASATVTINGVFALSWGFNAPVVDGAVGVLAQNGDTSFDSVRIRTNDPAFAAAGAQTASLQTTSLQTTSLQTTGLRTTGLQETTVTPFERRLDFGTAKSPVEAGTERVTNKTKYTSSLGYGWQSGKVSAADRKHGSALERDLNLTSAGTFVIDVPDGTYRVEVLLGDLGKKAHDQMGLSLEGIPVDPVTTAARLLAWQTYIVRVGDGQLTLDFADLGGRDKSVAIAALTVTAVSPDPSWPTVTIEPVAELPSGTAGPVQFLAVFSEPVAGFTADDVRIDWTGPGTVTATVAGRGSTYLVTVSGMAGNGTLDVSLGDDVAADLAGDLNFGSSIATVLYRYEKQFDFGSSKTAVEPGYRQVTQKAKYSPTTGFGWTQGRISAADRRTGSSLERDLNLTRDGTFVIDVPNGTYSVQMQLGDLGKTAHEDMGIFLEGLQRDTVSTAAGSLVSNVYQVTVIDGQLTVQLKDLGGKDPSVAIAGLTLTYVAPLGAAEGEGPVAEAPLADTLLAAAEIASSGSVDTTDPGAADVNGDGDVTPLDVLVLINAVNQQANGVVSVEDLDDESYDVNEDGILSAQDVLLVINQVNSAPMSGTPLAEGEAVQEFELRREPSADTRSDLYTGLDEYDVDDILAQGVSDRWKLDATIPESDDEVPELQALSRLAVDEALGELLQGV